MLLSVTVGWDLLLCARLILVLKEPKYNRGWPVISDAALLQNEVSLDLIKSC